MVLTSENVGALRSLVLSYARQGKDLVVRKIEPVNVVVNEKLLVSRNVIGMTGCPLYSPLTGLHPMNQRALHQTDYSSVGKLECHWICF